MKKIKVFKGIVWFCFGAALFFLPADKVSFAEDKIEKREKEIQELQKNFEWWPTDAAPAPVKDKDRSGYWWWPEAPGKISPWGNRGYIYVYKVIFDYKEEELPAPKPQELRASLLIKKTIKNTKIYFDYNKAQLRDDHMPILEESVRALKKNPETGILITGNCDRRGSETYNLELGKKRANAVKQYMLEKGIAEERIRIVSRGKLDALSGISDITGMQKDRNAHFVVAETEEVMMPYSGGLPGSNAKQLGEGKYIIEKEEGLESAVRVSEKTYVVKKGDTLWKIAEKECGAGHRWKYIYELNKDKISNPNKITAGISIIIPVE